MTPQQLSSSQPSRRHHLSTQLSHRTDSAWSAAMTVTALILLGLSLSGCGIGDNLWDLFHTDGDAEAQIFPDDKQRVRTFLIETNSFSIETSNDGDQSPTVQVNDSVTEYTMNSNGIVRFDESNGEANRRFDVESGDRIIERPGASGTGTVTIVDVSQST